VEERLHLPPPQPDTAHATCPCTASTTLSCYVPTPLMAAHTFLGAVNGCLGVSGCVFRDLNQLTGHIVGALLCICLVFGYITQVDGQVDGRVGRWAGRR